MHQPTLPCAAMFTVGSSIMASVYPEDSPLLDLPVADTVSLAIQNSDRDLTTLPDDLMTIEFVDQYIKSKSSASGLQHISKGYKYFHERYLETQ